MALVFNISCEKCGWHLGPTDGGNLYAVLDDGTRRPLPHPAEFTTALELTGQSLEELRKANRVGAELHYLCLQCGVDKYLDPQFDDRSCAICGHEAMVEVREAKNQTCPACKAGNLKQEHIGIS